MNFVSAYRSFLIEDNHKTQYLFESKGVRSIIKAIEYTYVGKKKGRMVYNLGFGDFDDLTGEIIDDLSSNNGDMYHVFSTVLDTVPKFFKNHKEAAILVQGSDSTDDFVKACKKVCKKKCIDTCKNMNRRINTYKYFIDKNFKVLSEYFIFFGNSCINKPKFVQYVPDNDYVGILVFKKK